MVSTVFATAAVAAAVYIFANRARDLGEVGALSQEITETWGEGPFLGHH